MVVVEFCFSSRRRHTRCALVTGVQMCALPIYGPITVIKAALNLPQTTFSGMRDGVFIDGIKQSALAGELDSVLRGEGRAAVLCASPIARTHTLAAMPQARVAVTLPHPPDGFELHGREGLAPGLPAVGNAKRGN